MMDLQEDNFLEPVLCAAILKSTKDIVNVPMSWKIGINIRNDFLTGETRFETFQANYSEGKASSCGPKCKFNNKEISHLVGYSPKDSITSEMLAKILKIVDDT
jgi:hypothetical protein